MPSASSSGRWPIAEIRNVEGRPTIDYTARDYDSILAAMRSLIPGKLSEWTDHGSEADFGRVLLELFAHMGDILSYYQDRVANESFLSTARTRRSVIEHLRLIGYELATAAPATATLEVRVPATVGGTVTVKRGDAFATVSERDRPSVRFEYNGAQPLVVDLDQAPIDSASGRKTFPLPVEQGRLVANEVLGVSDGSPDQRYPLRHTPVILRSRSGAADGNRDLTVVTQSGTITSVWDLRETLAFSHPSQRDYVVEIDEEDQATVIFGDGRLGRIPDNGAEVRASYRVGGGAAGNVGPKKIRTIVAAPSLTVLGATVTNPEPAVEGSEREPIERAIRHAPAVFRSLKRAVTTADYEALALDFPGVGKVRARASNWNVVTLHVAPAGGGAFVSDVLHRGLLAYFEDKRPISTRIEVVPVSYVDITVTAEIGVVPYYEGADVERRVRAAAGAVLAFENVDFDQPVYLSRFYEVIEAIDGVLFANVTEFRRATTLVNAAKIETSGVITLGEHELPRAPEGGEYQGTMKVVLKGGGA
jgi:hypothetical protein